jgi:hypothetical protein
LSNDFSFCKLFEKRKKKEKEKEKKREKIEKE